jgi:hypothetical protein
MFPGRELPEIQSKVCSVIPTGVVHDSGGQLWIPGIFNGQLFYWGIH